MTYFLWYYYDILQEFVSLQKYNSVIDNNLFKDES